MEDFVEDCYVEMDEEYEFDASQFFDFTRPELESQIEEVERWFQVSGDYPHSPFIVKLDLDHILPAEGVANSPKSSKSSRKSIKSTSSNNSDIDSRHGVAPSKKIAKGKGHPAPQEAAKPKIKQPQKLSQSRSSNFMEPTASHLAKQNTVHDKQQLSSQRLPRSRDKLERTKSSPVGSDIIKNSLVGSDNLGTKRQKLEIGFLKKGSHLKHKFSLSHKSNKVTVSREPGFETVLRSQRRRSKNSCASSEAGTPKHNAFKDHQPPNKKILQTRSLPRPTKSKAQLTEFQEFHFKTSERANHHSSAKENKSSTGETILGSSLTEAFNKLSLGSKSKRTSQSERRSSVNSKGSSSSRSSRGSFQSEFWR